LIQNTLQRIQFDIDKKIADYEADLAKIDDLTQEDINKALEEAIKQK